MNRDPIRIGTLPVDPVTRDGALAAIGELVRKRAGGYVVTPNVDHVVLAEHDRRLRNAYEAASLSLADGMPLLWASRLLGRRLPEKVSGSDLVAPLLALAAREGWSVYLLGGGPGVAAGAARRMQARLPGLRVCGVDAVPITLEEDDLGTAAALYRIARAAPDLVLLGLGCPKQEIWMHRHQRALAPAVALGVGASFDFLAGRVRRAPAWMSRVGLEWAWRLGREPRRLWRRYLVRDPEFLAILARSTRAPTPAPGGAAGPADGPGPRAADRGRVHLRA